ncbi:hypothetical protein AAMO2058_000627300 [Amorphochlora amoebiformis]
MEEKVESNEEGLTPEEVQVIEEFQAPCRVRNLLWCPTMDLLLLLAKTGDVLVYRISSTQRIAVIKAKAFAPTESKSKRESESKKKETKKKKNNNAANGEAITCMTWKHDGTQIALAHASGHVTLHDIVASDISEPSLARAGEALTLAQPHMASLTCLQWVSAQSRPPERGGKGFEFRIEDRSIAHFEPLPSTVEGTSFSAFGAREGGEERGKVEKRPYRDKVDYLVSGDEEGHIQIRAFGKLTILQLDVKKAAKLKSKIRIFSAGLSLDSQTLSVLALVEKPAKKGGGEKGGGHSSLPQLLTFDTSIFGTRREEFRALSVHMCEINYLISYAHTCLTSMRSRWTSAYQAVNRRLKLVTQAIEDHGGEPNARVEVELLHLLVTGMPSKGLEVFLIEYLSLNRLLDLRRGIERAGAAVLQMAQANLHPALEQIIFRLGELTGLARWLSSYGDMEMKSVTLAKASRAAEMAMTTLEGFRRAVMNSQKGFSLFFTWLTDARGRVTGNEEKDIPPPPFSASPQGFLAIAMCIQRNLTKDTVGAFFKRGSVEGGGKDPMKSSEKEKPWRGPSLEQAFMNIRKTWRLVIDTPAEAVSNHVTLRAVVRIDSSVVPSNGVMALNSHIVDGYEYAAFVRNERPEREASAGELKRKNKSRRNSADKGNKGPVILIVRTSKERRLKDYPGMLASQRVDAVGLRVCLEDILPQSYQITSVSFYDATHLAAILKLEEKTSYLALIKYHNAGYKLISPKERGNSKTVEFDVNPGIPEEPAEVSRIIELKRDTLGLTVCSGRSSAAVLDSKMKVLAVDLAEMDEDEDEDEEDDAAEEEGVED